MSENQITLAELYSMVEEKISKKEDGSYSYELAKGGVAKITRKVGEEALEVVIASFIHEQNPDDKNRSDLIGEVCDLLYHNLVLLASQKIELSEIITELTKRNKIQK